MSSGFIFLAFGCQREDIHSKIWQDDGVIVALLVSSDTTQHLVSIFAVSEDGLAAALSYSFFKKTIFIVWKNVIKEGQKFTKGVLCYQSLLFVLKQRPMPTMPQNWVNKGNSINHD